MSLFVGLGSPLATQLSWTVFLFVLLEKQEVSCEVADRNASSQE